MNDQPPVTGRTRIGVLILLLVPGAINLLR